MLLTLFKLGGFMSFSDKNCYLGLGSDTARPLCWNFSWFVLFPTLSTSGECPRCLLQIHEDGDLRLMISCEFALKAALTLEMQEVFGLGLGSRSRCGSSSFVPWVGLTVTSPCGICTPGCQLLIPARGDWEQAPHELCILHFRVAIYQRHYLQLQSIVNQS